MSPHRFAIATAAATLFLIFWGGLVTGTASGDSVPDWWFVPVSRGSLLPPMTGGVLYEHGHRLIATVVGIMTVILAVLLARREPRRWVRTLGWVAVAGVIAQGVLGGLRVLFPLHHETMAIAHAALAQTFFCAVVVLAAVTAPGWRSVPAEPPPRALFPAAVAASTAAFLQLLLGAYARHTAGGLVFHVAGAFVVTALAAWASVLAVPVLSRLAVTLAALLFAQLALGFAAFVIVEGGFVRSTGAAAVPLAIVTAHVMVGALVLASCVTLTVGAARQPVALRQPQVVP